MRTRSAILRARLRCPALIRTQLSAYSIVPVRIETQSVCETVINIATAGTVRTARIADRRAVMTYSPIADFTNN
jgi:hypothetical protein